MNDLLAVPVKSRCLEATLSFSWGQRLKGGDTVKKFLIFIAIVIVIIAIIVIWDKRTNGKLRASLKSLVDKLLNKVQKAKG